MIAYKYDKDTKEYIGEAKAYLDQLETKKAGHDIYLLPANSTFIKPHEFQPERVSVWNGNSWDIVEDHRGKSGYVNNKFVTITELGPLPETWSDSEESIEIPPETVILNHLSEIDSKSIRATRSILISLLSNESPDQQDIDVLTSYENEAKKQRNELLKLKSE